MVKFVEDVQRLLPGVAGTYRIYGRAGVTEVSQNVGLAEPVAEFPGQAKGMLVADGRLSVAAQVVLGIAEAVPRVRFATAVP